jgi:hypothetical protein
MDRNLVLPNRNIVRLRRDVRLQSSEIEQLIAADLDCTPAAQRLMRAQAALVLFLEKRARTVNVQSERITAILNKMERIVAIGEAEVLGLSIATLRRWEAAGKLAAEHVELYCAR